MTEAAKKQEAEPLVPPTRCHPAEAHRQEWVVDVSSKVQSEDLLKPEFWSLIASRLRPYARLEVRREDGTMMWDVLVTACERVWAKVQILHEYKLGAQDIDLGDTDPFETKWCGPSAKWRVIRKSDGKVLAEGLENKDAVNTWVTENQHLLTG